MNIRHLNFKLKKSKPNFRHRQKLFMVQRRSGGQLSSLQVFEFIIVNHSFLILFLKPFNGEVLLGNIFLMVCLTKEFLPMQNLLLRKDFIFLGGGGESSHLFNRYPYKAVALILSFIFSKGHSTWVCFLPACNVYILMALRDSIHLRALRLSRW